MKHKIKKDPRSVTRKSQNSKRTTYVTMSTTNLTKKDNSPTMRSKSQIEPRCNTQENPNLNRTMICSRYIKPPTNEKWLYTQASQPLHQPGDAIMPFSMPASLPATHPCNHPASQPSSHPAIQPTSQPANQPTSHSANQPNSQPASQPTIKSALEGGIHMVACHLGSSV